MEMIEKEAANGESTETKSGKGLVIPRELNPALFGESASRSKVFEGTPNHHLPHLMQTEQKILDLKAQMSVLAEAMGKWTSNYNDLVKGTQLKFDRVQQVMVKLESNDQYIVTESAQKFSRINDRLAERKLIDAKIQEMVDRHNSVLKSFEMRMNQMQKLVAEKEALLASMQSALNEARMEIARLKRL